MKLNSHFQAHLDFMVAKFKLCSLCIPYVTMTKQSDESLIINYKGSLSDSLLIIILLILFSSYRGYLVQQTQY